MSEYNKSINQLLVVMDQQNVQIGVYSIAIMGLAVALRTVRPFSRFTRPSDIPKRFIKSRTKLNGTVESIEPSGAVLMVQHKPLFHLLRTKVNSLPVKISGVTVNGHGISWLHSIVAGNEVTFIPVLKQKDFVQCEVTMQQKTHDDKLKIVNIGPSLVEIGFGKVDTIDKTLQTNPFYRVYLKELQAAKITAEKRRLGKWYYLKSGQEISQAMLSNMLKFIQSRMAIASKKAKITKKLDESKDVKEIPATGSKVVAT